MPGQTVMRAAGAPAGRRNSSSASVLDWYAAGLRSKLARAVTEGRADASRAAELDRLMIELLHGAPRRGADDGRLSVDRPAST